MIPYPKRLIEVDLPIKRISAHARREKSIRHGHISTLHIWWARRPLAACRAVICAALWPDPADDQCPPAFRQAAADQIVAFARQVMRSRKLAESCSPESFGRWKALGSEDVRIDVANPDHLNNLRFALLDFIADFANWDNSTVPEYLLTAKALTQAAHEALGGLPGTRPLVVDPFAGGGAIPLEALRVGADTFASDLNPVAVLLNKVVLEYIPKFGGAEFEMRDASGEKRVFHGLAEAVRYWGNWIKELAEQELAEFYPKDPDGATPIAYLWARTITCEGPGCGAELPLIQSLWLAQKGRQSVALRLVKDMGGKQVGFELVRNAGPEDVQGGTVDRGAATCPICGYTTAVESVRNQLKQRRGGTNDARLICVVVTRDGRKGRDFRLVTRSDVDAAQQAKEELERRQKASAVSLSLVPTELLDVRGIRHTWVMIYGLECWQDYYTPRQGLTLGTLARLVGQASAKMGVAPGDRFEQASDAVRVCVALAVDRVADRSSSLTRWDASSNNIGGTFGRQALPMVWNFAETGPLAQASGDWSGAVEWISKVIDEETKAHHAVGVAEQFSAVALPLPDDSAQAFITDPPYYDAVPYSYLSDFFYVWLRRTLGITHPQLFSAEAVPKDSEIVVDRMHELSHSTHDIAYYEGELTRAFSEGRRVAAPNAIGTIVFASKTTASWEAILQAVVKAGWIVTSSWPIDTELETRVAARGQARLASSVHLACRPRETPVGSLQANRVGDWREVLQELPSRIHAWLPRLASEGVVGADAIFACLGPALEIFSRYSKVEKASGEVVTLSQYLEHVWAAVSKEALDMVFAGADTSGFEEDARLTAMWLWTLGSDGNGTDEDKVVPSTGYSLEYDAARKIAQGLGAHLEQLGHLVEVKGSNARLLPVRERTKHLFGRETVQEPARRSKDSQQLALFAQLPAEEADVAGWTLNEDVDATPGQTTLDRVHQAMLFFAAGRSNALKRFLIDEGVGKDERFWRLAQALSALYPSHTDEKRWVDGVLARKKGLGF